MPTNELIHAVLLRVARDEGYDVSTVPDDVAAALEDWLEDVPRREAEEAHKADVRAWERDRGVATRRFGGGR